MKVSLVTETGNSVGIIVSGSVTEFAQFLQQAVLETAIHQPLTKILERINHLATTLANLQAVDSRLATAIQESINDQKQAADDQGKAIQQIKDQAAKIADLISKEQIDPAAVQAEVDALTAKADSLEQSNSALKQSTSDLEANLTAPAGTVGDGTGTSVDLGSTGNEAGSDGSAPTDANSQHPSNADIGATSLDTGATTDESIGAQK